MMKKLLPLSVSLSVSVSNSMLVCGSDHKEPRFYDYSLNRSKLSPIGAEGVARLYDLVSKRGTMDAIKPSHACLLTHDSKTLLHAAVATRDVAKVKALLTRIPPVNWKDMLEKIIGSPPLGNIENPLITAIMDGNRDMVDCLLRDLPFLLPLIGFDSCPVAHLMVECGLSDMIPRLPVSYITDRNIRGSNLLHIAVIENDKELIERLLVTYLSMLDEETHYQETPVTFSLVAQNVSLFEYLMTKDPFHFSRHLDTVKPLLFHLYEHSNDIFDRFVTRLTKTVDLDILNAIVESIDQGHDLKPVLKRKIDTTVFDKENKGRRALLKRVLPDEDQRPNSLPALSIDSPSFTDARKSPKLEDLQSFSLRYIRRTRSHNTFQGAKSPCIFLGSPRSPRCRTPLSPVNRQYGPRSPRRFF